MIFIRLLLATKWWNQHRMGNYPSSWHRWKKEGENGSQTWPRQITFICFWLADQRLVEQFLHLKVEQMQEKGDLFNSRAAKFVFCLFDCYCIVLLVWCWYIGLSAGDYSSKSNCTDSWLSFEIILGDIDIHINLVTSPDPHAVLGFLVFWSVLRPCVTSYMSYESRGKYLPLNQQI